MEKFKQTHFRLGGADGFRAIACLLVVIVHLVGNMFREGQAPWLQNVLSFFSMGNVGVSIFFVLSGFLLSYPFWKKYLEGDAFPSIKQYALRRFARIAPGYYVAIIVAVIAANHFELVTEHFWARLIAGITFTSGFHYITFFPSEMNGPLWSISFEMFCYLLMPLFMFALFRFFGKNRSFLTGILFWIGVFFLILILNQLIHSLFVLSEEGRGFQYGIIGGAKFWMPNYNPIGLFGHFALGIFAAGVSVRLFQVSEKTKRFKHFGGFDLLCLGALFLSFALLGIMRYFGEFDFSLQRQPFYFPMYATFIAISLCTAAHTRWAAKILDNPFFRFTSKISFGLYIWHYLIMRVSSLTWAKEYRWMNMTDLGKWASISLVILVVSYVFATISFYLVEKPVLDWSHGRRGVFNKRRETGLGA
ncbi:acyltransferase [Paenibacillus sp. GSMTC-2017]|uniref:acyltransferase family protein n=1 Tax=Paenibacillus sp. GSMTC-2017 TaxID=2794350 RepID=UPI0018D7B0FF|nr:acyltransferase [Paenibacillus sp. GSMTC-2017]MBH5317044.1 acyltransferase [Paenibacillus sp. GSMTC-2017]